MTEGASTRRPDLERTPILAIVAHGVGASWFAALYAPIVIAFVALAAGAGGAVLGTRLAGSRLRGPLLPLVGVGIVALGLAWNALFTRYSLLPSLLGPTVALRLGEIGAFGVGAFGVSCMLRALASRRRSFVALEAIAFASIALQILVGHRYGAINRPFEVADAMLLAGQDPAIAFYAFGALAAVFVAILMLRERSRWRSLYHFAFLAVLLFSCFAASIARLLPFPSPEAARSEAETEERERPSGHGGQGTSNQGGSSNSRVPVAVVVFHDDVSSPLETYYFREETFSRFVGPRLVAGIDPDLVAAIPTEPIAVTEPPPAASAREEVETTVATLMGMPHPIGLESPVRYRRERNPNVRRFDSVYRVTSRVASIAYDDFVGSPVGSPDWTEQERALYTTPHPDSRYPALAARIVSELLPPDLQQDPVAQAAAITTWLGREGQYSLHHRSDSGPDPGSEFLFGDRIGFCVHFANAAVHLMRALGIPSRVGAGYAVAESERQGGSSLLLMKHMAHAWPEIYVEGEGWLVADVFPQRSLEPPFAPSDVELARLLGEMARGEIPEPPTPSTPAADAVAAVIRAAPRFGRAFLVLLGAVVVALYLAKLARRVHPLVASSSGMPRAAYRSVADALAESGLRRARGESREAFAARIVDRVPSFVAVTDVLEARAFGGRAYEARVPELRALSRSARRELRATVPLVRRIVAALDPVSFLTAR